MAACSPSDSESSIGSTDLEHMLNMPNPFDAPLTAEERSMLDGFGGSDSESCYPDDDGQKSMPSTSQAAAPAACEQYKSKRGKYSRTNGKGIRIGWGACAAKHTSAISSGKLLTEVKCSPNCDFGHTCMQNSFTITILRKCAARVFGECVLDGKSPSIGNHQATRAWFDLAFACRIVVANEVTGIDFNIEGRRVCQGAFQAAYSIPASTMDEIVRRIFAGHHAWVTYALTATAKPRSDKPTLLRIAATWWLKTLRCYDIMPHLRGVIIHPHANACSVRVSVQVCVWKEIYMNDFLPHARSKGYTWSADPDKAGSNASWRAGKAEALRLYAEETYGPEYGKPFRLIARSDHSAFKECAECKRLRLAVARAISEGKDHTQIQRHKALQKEHLDWFMAQRNELETLRQSGAREDTIFEQVRARTPT
eukprot:6212105-Pleurochrysis_carterae.AAC.2